MTTTGVDKEVLYLSFDIEADGDSPVLNSMLSIGIYGFDKNGKGVVEFQRNMYPHPSKVVDKRSISEFWERIQKAWSFVKTNQIPQKSV